MGGKDRVITTLEEFTPDTIGKESAFICCDCMEAMKRMPDKCIDLAIVDPPYGIGIGSTMGIGRGGYDRPFGGNYSCVRGIKEGTRKAKFYHAFDDSSPPDEQYFRELRRVSKEQIIWGGNFFLDHLGRASCLIVWDKARRNMDQADCEIAWTSLKGQSRVFNFRWNGMLQEDMKHKEKRIHPTQKPVALYEWILDRFAKPGDIILDTHVGSASSLIACHKSRHKFIGCEIDPVLYDMARTRLETDSAQVTIFDYMEEAGK
jgi:site-specific DNA-methyltransferase (adenine-specific)